MNDDLLSIGQVAEAVGMSAHALRFYEKEGLLIGPVARASNGARRFTKQDVEWLKMCTRLRASEMPLSDVHRYAELVRQGPGNEDERLRLLAEHRTRIEERIAVFESARELISWKADVYEQHLRSGSATGFWDPTASRNV